MVSCRRGARIENLEMKMSREELIRRLAEADRIRAVLRKATLEWRAIGEQVLKGRPRGPERPHHGSPPRR